nr:MAG TPA: hypothetical protein [Caudoviricetes sp.]
MNKCSKLCYKHLQNFLRVRKSAQNYVIRFSIFPYVCIQKRHSQECLLLKVFVNTCESIQP